MAKPQYSGPWQKIRLEVLERDGYMCQVRGRRCKVAATQVDHIVAIEDGGAWWDKANLRASCWPCNRDRVKGGHTDRWKRSATRIVLVVGPPGAGHAGYVRDHKGADDLVIDYDAIAHALGADDGDDGNQSVHRSVMAARNAVLNSLRRGESDARRAWIISANPKAESVFPFHERVVVDPGSVDLLRAGNPGGPQGLGWSETSLRLVAEWYATRSGHAVGVESSASRDWTTA